MYTYTDNTRTGVGHICTGGGAEIKNSPIHLHIHIHSGDEKLIQKITRGIHGIFGQRHRAIEGAAELSEHDIQRGVIRTIESG